MEQEHFESFYPDTSRFAEIEQLLTFVKEGSSCQLLGIPGVSRSTILGLLAYSKTIRKKHLGEEQANFHFVVVNFSEIRKRPLFDAMKFMFLNLTESLRERGLTEENKVVGQKFREHLGFHDELVLFQGFKEAVAYLAFERKITTVFLFDRFEEYIPTVTSEFFTNMRTLRSHAKYHFSIVFSLNRSLESVLDPTLLADYYEFVAGHLVPVHLADEPSTTFRISYIEKVLKKQLPKTVLSEILAITGGHGKLTKLAVETMLAHPEESKNLQELLLSQKTVRGALLEIWRSFSPAEQSDLLHGNFDDTDVADYLREVEVIKENKLQIPLFASFVRREFSNASSAGEHIVYDEHTNTVRKGADVLSDQLTSSEFRLLRYLLQNPERIVERDELISIVWEGVKSTAGITDQAVDQLIFRLRRKIEEDPNNPIHLQTVKGRGFKFTT
jgi:DNA-binding winged helix-turn-helix (wHTH) protein